MRNFSVPRHGTKVGMPRRTIKRVSPQACLHKTRLAGCRFKMAVINRFQGMHLKKRLLCFLTSKSSLMFRDPSPVQRRCGQLRSTPRMEGWVPSLAPIRSGLGHCRILVPSCSVKLLGCFCKRVFLTLSVHRFTQEARQALCNSCPCP